MSEQTFEGQGFQGRVAVVTGGASGIGAAAVRKLIEAGASVVAADLDDAGLARTEAELGDRFAPIRCNVCSEDDVEAMVAFAVERFGRVDLAFNIAGAARVGPIVDTTLEDWKFTVDVCLQGTFLCMKHEGRQMLAQGDGGAIINIGSQNSHTPMFEAVAYCAAKAGVAMVSECGALEWGEDGIRVNTVSPGFVDTPLSAGLQENPAAFAKFMERIPAKRMARPEEIVAAAMFLASDDASYISGVNLKVDAGWSTTGAPDLRGLLG